MFHNSKVLVAGGAGFLGSNFVERLLDEGAEVRATWRQRKPKVEDSRVEFVQADLTQLEDCRRAVDGIDYVFMCAANTSGAAVMVSNPLVHVTPNVVMNAHMLEAAHQARVRKFLFVSSSAAYPDSDRPLTEEQMFESDPPEVYYAVGWMKRYAEILCKTYALKVKNPMPTVVIRPSNVYGPHDKFDFGRSHVTAALIRRVVERQNPFEVWGTGDDSRDLIFVDDFIEGCMAAMDSEEPFGVYNISSERNYSIKEVMAALFDLENFHPDVCFRTDKPSTIKRRAVSASRAREAFGFGATTTLEAGLRRTLEWSKGRFDRIEVAV